MAESTPASSSTPSLSQYFRTKEADDNMFAKELCETSDKISSLQLDNDESKEESTLLKDEPQVCRVFAETPVQPKDPTALFFDLIGNSQSSGSTRLISDMSLPTDNDESFVPQVAAGSEVDRRRDAWIPSERTRRCLASCVSSSGTYSVDRELLTAPGVLLEEELGDSVAEAVAACLGEAEAAQRRSLAAGDVTQDERGLRELVQAGAYRAAINLTARLLTIYGQGRFRAGQPSKHSPHSLQLWFTRIALLVKTKAFNIAQAEAERFGQLDNPDVFYQFYPEMYGSRPGSIASFSFRLLLAELPMHCGKPKESLTKLFSVLAVVRQILSNLKEGLREDGSPVKISDEDRSESTRLWRGREVRCMHSIINCNLALKDYGLAMDMLGQLIDREGTPRDALLSAMGRLHLQMGDVAGAEVCFDEALEVNDGTPDVRHLVDRGLLGVARGAFDEAYVCFQKAKALEPSNVMILNNMGVCLLYGGQLKQAIAILESAIASNPVDALHESLLLNLCTLYDMESSKGRMKKFALLKQLSKHHADAPTMILEKLYG